MEKEELVKECEETSGFEYLRALGSRLGDFCTLAHLSHDIYAVQ